MATRTVNDEAILSRIQYLNEYLFAGNVQEFEKQLGFYRRRLEYILRRQAKIPLHLLVTLVVDFGVSAAWLLTGHGPVLANQAFSPVSDNATNPHALFDATALRVSMCRPAFKKQIPVSRAGGVDLAKTIFNARVHKAPVVLLFDAPAIKPKRRWAVLSLLRENRVTALATTTRALYKDVGSAESNVIPAARFAARAGIGFGLAVGRWLTLSENSVFRNAYDLNVPISVYYQPGDDPRYFEYALLGPTVGAELGAVAQIDLFVLAEQIRLLVTTKHSVCIDATNNKSITALLANMIAAAHRTTDERHGCFYQINNRLLPFVAKTCQTIFEGSQSANR